MADCCASLPSTARSWCWNPTPACRTRGLFVLVSFGHLFCTSSLTDNFFLALAVCHCLRVEKAGDVMQYTGLSPDEEALAKAAKLVSPYQISNCVFVLTRSLLAWMIKEIGSFVNKSSCCIWPGCHVTSHLTCVGSPQTGIELKDRTESQMVIDYRGKAKIFQIVRWDRDSTQFPLILWLQLHVFEFESSRQRMSIIVRDNDTGQVGIQCIYSSVMNQIIELVLW